MGHRTASGVAFRGPRRLFVLILCTLIFAGLAGQRSAPRVAAQAAPVGPAVTQPCTAAGTVLTCNVTTDLTVAQGGTLVLTLGIPTGATFISSTPIGTCPQTINNGATPPNVTYGPCTSALAPGQVITEVLQLPSATGACTNSGGGTFLCATVTATYNANGPVSPSSSTGTCAIPDSNDHRCENFMVSGLVPGNSITFTIDISNTGGGPADMLATNCGVAPNPPACTTVSPPTLGTCPLTSNTMDSNPGNKNFVVFTCGPGQSSPALDVVVSCLGSPCSVNPPSYTGPPIESVTIAGVTVPTPTDIVYGFSRQVPSGGVATAAAPYCVPTSSTTFQCSYLTSETVNPGGTLTETIVVPNASGVPTGTFAVAGASTLSCGGTPVAPVLSGTPIGSALTYSCPSSSGVAATQQPMFATVTVPPGTPLVTVATKYNANGPFTPGGATGACTVPDSTNWACSLYLQIRGHTWRHGDIYDQFL
jgi:hypothetical protein